MKLDIQHKIILRHAKGWQAYDTARLHISVPANPTYDPRTRSVINWALSNFDNIILCLHDTIQRHNFMAAGFEADAAYDKALKNGDAWLAANILPPDVFIDVMRWDGVLAYPNYATINKQVQNLYATNEKFAAAVDYDLDSFMERCRKRGEPFASERVVLSRIFLLEEIAGYIPLYQQTSAVDLHSGMRMKAMQLLLDGMGDFKLRDNLMVSVKTFDLKNTGVPVNAAA